MSTCKHERTISGDYRAFVGPVYTPGVTDENQVAHGNVVYTETCANCGARREVNSNAGVVEVSAWGPTVEERRERVSRLREEATRIYRSLADQVYTLRHGDGRRVEVRVDSDGYLVLSPADQIAGEALAATIPGVVASAAELRRARIAAAEAAEEV